MSGVSQRCLKHREPRGQRGVALVTALLVVSLATVAAVAMAMRQQIDVRRTANLLHGEQAYAYAVAAESWARVILRRLEYPIESAQQRIRAAGLPDMLAERLSVGI